MPSVPGDLLLLIPVAALKIPNSYAFFLSSIGMPSVPGDLLLLIPLAALKIPNAYAFFLSNVFCFLNLYFPIYLASFKFIFFDINIYRFKYRFSIYLSDFFQILMLSFQLMFIAS